MSVSVPRGTRAARLSLRVPGALKDQVDRSVTELQSRGLRTSTSEFVEMLVEHGLKATPDDLEARLLDWRKRTPEAPRV